MGWRETNQWEERENVELNIERREKMLNKKLVFLFGICVRTVSYLRRYCSMLQNYRTFRTPHETWIVVFGVPNAKYLTFGTLDENALRSYVIEVIILIRAINHCTIQHVWVGFTRVEIQKASFGSDKFRILLDGHWRWWNGCRQSHSTESITSNGTFYLRSRWWEKTESVHKRGRILSRGWMRKWTDTMLMATGSRDIHNGLSSPQETSKGKYLALHD